MFKLLSAAVIIFSCQSFVVNANSVEYAPAQVSTCFRPSTDGGCIDSIVAAIGLAKTEIRVQAYNFTSPPILAALAKAKKDGIDVQIILDKINDPILNPSKGKHKARYSGADFMNNSGILVMIDRKPSIAHNKLIIIDRHLVIGGSYNYSVRAERNNAENVTFIDSGVVASWFLDNWNKRFTVSERFVPLSR